MLAATIIILLLGVPLAIVVIATTYNSEKVEQAKAFLMADEQFKWQIGKIVDVGYMVSDKVAFDKRSSYMRLDIEGSKKSAFVVIFFTKIPMESGSLRDMSCNDTY